MKRSKFLILLLAAIANALSCIPSDNNNSDKELKGPGRIQWAQFYDPLRPQAINPPINLRSARNETISFALQINSPADLASRRSVQLRLTPLQAVGTSIAIKPTAWQVVPMPIDTNRAAFARHTGLNVGLHRIPRALLPLAVENNAISLSTVRDPDEPTNPRLRPSRIAPLIWIDVHIPSDAFCCNIGDLMARWSNDRWVSTLHRVAVPPPGAVPTDRISLVFFQNPNPDTVIRCFESCVRPGETEKYPPITVAEHYLGKLIKAGHSRLDAKAEDALTDAKRRESQTIQ